ncbi:CRAL/TRIO domain protein [Aphelenchoides fujianensis]|nr:CRAL/TRIO domain protein [Aphelenchoides fujianensis]
MTVKTQIDEADRLRIAQLRELTAEDLKGNDYYNTEFNILRWLQGHRDCSIEEVAKKLSAHLKMRKSCWKLDDLVRKPRNHPIHKHWKYGITKESKMLRNVVVNSGENDYKGMLATWSIQEVMLARAQDLEDMLAEVMSLEMKTGQQASILYVMDLTNLVYDKKLIGLVTGAMRSLAEFMSTHYVELIKYFVLVNVPSYVYAMWTLVKPLLPERTRQKVRILSSSNWREEILEFSCPEALPERWNDEEHTSFSHPLELPVPYPVEQYYKNRNLHVGDVETLRLAAGKTIVLHRELKAGDRFSWWIHANCEFGFGFFFHEDRGEEDISKMDVVYPQFEWMPHSEVPLDTGVVVEKSGLYRIWFSNYRAWWHTANIQHRFTVTSGNTE